MKESPRRRACVYCGKVVWLSHSIKGSLRLAVRWVEMAVYFSQATTGCLGAGTQQEQPHLLRSLV